MQTDTENRPMNPLPHRERRKVAMRSLIPGPPVRHCRRPRRYRPAPNVLRSSTDGTGRRLPGPSVASRRKCFAATCWPDPTQPDDWGRRPWWSPTNWRPGHRPTAPAYSDIIDFNAHLHGGAGRKTTWPPVRWYGITLSRSRSELVVHGSPPQHRRHLRHRPRLRSVTPTASSVPSGSPHPTRTRPTLRPRLHAADRQGLRRPQPPSRQPRLNRDVPRGMDAHQKPGCEKEPCTMPEL